MNNRQWVSAWQAARLVPSSDWLDAVMAMWPQVRAMVHIHGTVGRGNLSVRGC